MIPITKGGLIGHCLRRIVHALMILIPIFYYIYAQRVLKSPSFDKAQAVSLVVLIILCLDWVRLKRGWIIFGQRIYEAHTMSAFAWGALSVGLTLLAAPKLGKYDAAVGFPLIGALALGDPMIGEFRIHGFTAAIQMVVGGMVITCIWLFSMMWLGTPWWIIPVIVPLTVASERIKMPHIVDNATMLLIPLGAVLLLAPWC